MWRFYRGNENNLEVYFNVSYDQREQAKRLKLRWDSDKKMWGYNFLIEDYEGEESGTFIFDELIESKALKNFKVVSMVYNSCKVSKDVVDMYNCTRLVKRKFEDIYKKSGREQFDENLSKVVRRLNIYKEMHEEDEIDIPIYKFILRKQRKRNKNI